MIVQSLLEQLGLTVNEVKLYLLLLDLGPSNAGILIKKSGFQSSVVYHLLGRLQEKGIVSFTVEKTQKVYNATDPAHFRTLLDQQEEQIKKTKHEFEKLLPELQARKKRTHKENKVQVYSGREGLKAAFNDLLQTTSEYIVYGGTGHFTPLIPVYQKFFEAERVRKKIKQRSLFFGEKRENAKFQQTKYLDPNYNLPFSFVTYNDKVLINIFEEDPNVTIMIESKTLASGFRNFFDDLWKRTK